MKKKVVRYSLAQKNHLQAIRFANPEAVIRPSRPNVRSQTEYTTKLNIAAVSLLEIDLVCHNNQGILLKSGNKFPTKKFSYQYVCKSVY